MVLATFGTVFTTFHNINLLIHRRKVAKQRTLIVTIDGSSNDSFRFLVVALFDEGSMEFCQQWILQLDSGFLLK
jgi:hypothetical protein